MLAFFQWLLVIILAPVDNLSRKFSWQLSRLHMYIFQWLTILAPVDNLSRKFSWRLSPRHTCIFQWLTFSDKTSTCRYPQQNLLEVLLAAIVSPLHVHVHCMQ